MSSLKFECGCEIQFVDGRAKIDYDNLNKDCPKVWDLYCNGETRSIFQLESFLCKTWAKELKPRNIDEAAALIAIIRPAMLNNVDSDNKSLTKLFCERKNNGWIPSENSVMENLLYDTYGMMCYQENIMLIAKEIADFDGVSQVKLIKGIGRKDADIIFAFEKQFIDGCLRANKVTSEEAVGIFDQIKSAARYGFNRCISGTEKFRQVGINNGYHPTIEEIYKIATDIEYAKQTGHLSLHKKYKLTKSFGYALSMCQDGRIRKNKVVSIRPAGIRQCFKVKLESGKECSVTENHKFPTPNGEKKLSQLKVGDYLYTCCNYEKTNKKFNFSDYSNDDIRLIRKNGGGKIPHGNFSEFVKSKKLLDTSICNICSKQHQRIEIHHINGDRKNNIIDNLIALCPSCHKKEEYKLGRRKRGEKGYPRQLEKIISIEKGSIETTYDVTMEAPNHNYVTSNNIVTSNSHAISYAVLGYQTAWVKAHFPEQYICAWLRIAKNEAKPLEEVRAVVSEARRLGIEVLGPSIKNLPKHDFFIEKGRVYFGISTIKNCSEAGLRKLIDKSIDYKSINWTNFLVNHSDTLNKKQLISMIQAGCFDCYHERTRMQCQFEYEQWATLTKLQQKNVRALYTGQKSIIELLKDYLKTKDVEKIKIVVYNLENPPSSLEDSKPNMIAHEKELLGVNITCSHISRASIPDSVNLSTDLGKNFVKNRVYTLVGEIQDFREVKIKNGKMAGSLMASFKLIDKAGELDVVVFPKELDLFQAGLYDGNMIMLNGKESPRGGLILDSIYEV